MRSGAGAPACRLTSTATPIRHLSEWPAGGAGDGNTQRANVEAFSRYGIVPRMLVGASERDLSVSLFDMRLPTPLFMAPVGVIGVCSQDLHGDIQTAQASAQTGVPMIASTLTQDRMEDVIPHAAMTPNFFQLYTPTDKELAASFLRRAEQSGYKAVVITLDTWITGWRTARSEHRQLPPTARLLPAKLLHR
jgi:lactate 2-monooxygenase